MKLVVDIDQIIGNLGDLSTGSSDFQSACSTFSGSSCSSSISSITSTISSYKDSIASDLEDISTKSTTYVDLVDDCCSSYQENENNTTEISMESISNIISNSSELFNDYEGNASKDLTSLPSTDVVTVGSFGKYEMTEDELMQMTAICLHEQGTAKGAAAEASLMANRFELYGSKYGDGTSGLMSYVENSGWFAHASSHMSDTSIVNDEAYEAVKSVLVDGKRTLPGYVDEHDCISDISSVSNNGSSFSTSDRSSYTSNTTVINNCYGSTYTFYCFPDDGSDPFGYTSEDKRDEIGDFCYAYEA